MILLTVDFLWTWLLKCLVNLTTIENEVRQLIKG